MLELITLLWLTLHLNRDARNEEEGEKRGTWQWQK